jgi:flagellin
MTRINTNVSSSIAQSNLARSHASLQVSLQRLSTGLRINVGKDDPAGLIASENLRSDITSIERAITNSERANQLIGTADSGLGQVSSLLNDIRGLVSEAANTGALSKEQIEANQLQVDSSLEAIDRIAQTTAFQGRKLLDGSLDFTTTSPGNNLVAATAAVTVATDSAATATISASGANNDLVITAKATGLSANGYSVRFSSGSVGPVTVSLTGTEFEVLLSGAVTASAIADALSATAGFNSLFSVSNAASNDGTGLISVGTLPTAVTAGGGAVASALSLTAVTAGTGANAYTINVTSGSSLSASLSGNTFTITLSSGNSTAAEVAAAISASGVFTATVSGSTTALVSAGATVTAPTAGLNNGGNISDLRIDQANFGSQSSIAVEILIDAQATQGQLTYSGGALSGDLILEVGGKNGFEVFNFGSGNTTTQIRDAINLVSDATGISASLSGTDLVLKSTEYGSNSFVSVRALSGSFDTYNGSTATTRDAGSDVSARINGVVATGDGLLASINTSTLDIGFKVNENLSAGSTVNFNITGGGAVFQLGPDVVSNQQARLGIQGVNTATLGGSDGTLFELRTGGSKALATDVKAAAKVVDQVISKVTSLRGRLGAFQKTTLETNIFTLTDTLSNLTDAQSSIRDADFAKETAALTRAQILVQAGTSVLTIANQNPQQVLALLR